MIDAATRDRLVADDPACADVIKPYQRGQDVERWWSPPSGLYMIVLKSSTDHRWPWADDSDELKAEQHFRETYPSLHAHMKKYEEIIDPKTGKARGLRHREDHGRFWWELRACAYYGAFDRSRLAYPDLSWSPSFQMLGPGTMVSNLAYIIPTDEPALAVLLNAPVLWWYLSTSVEHGKDEVLRLFTSFMEQVPIAPSVFSDDVRADVARLQRRVARIKSADADICDWLHHEFGLGKSVRALENAHLRDADAFVTAVRAALPKKKRKFSSAEIARLKQEHAATLTPAREAAAEVLALERKLSDLVNAAFGLSRGRGRADVADGPAAHAARPKGRTSSPQLRRLISRRILMSERKPATWPAKFRLRRWQTTCAADPTICGRGLRRWRPDSGK